MPVPNGTARPEILGRRLWQPTRRMLSAARFLLLVHPAPGNHGYLPRKSVPASS